VRASQSTVPTGTVSFLFTDIEGSTSRWETYGDAMRAAVERHDALMREAVGAHNGYVFKTIGDAFCVAFHTPADAVNAAHRAQREFYTADWTDVDGIRVRMSLHVGSVESRDGDYFGRPLNRVARLLGVVNGGQVVLTGAAAELVADSLPDGLSLLHLGQHRLKDLEIPEHVYQLVAADVPSTFGPLRSLESRPNNLPVQLTSFIGREREIEELREPLATSHLLTLAGPGGVGKTRLALQLAADALDSYPDGVWLIELSPIQDAEAVADATATALSLRVNAKEPVTTSIVRELRDKRSLLIFDSCEHLIVPAAALVTTVLQASPDVHVLATSREALHVSGERVHQISVLDEPSAIKLFVARAQDASPRFVMTEQNAPVIADICRRLDGIALAIELAATKIAVLSPQQLLARLNERFRLLAGGSRTALPRQQTLRALIDWSYDLLDEHERLVFRRLAVFAGSFSLEAASVICADEAVDDWRVFELLATLVSKSLVVVEPDGEERRYRLLDSMRDYALERLVQAGERAEVTLRHVRYYEALTERVENANEDQASWRKSMEPEVDNLRAALDEAFRAGGDTEAGLRMLTHLPSAALIVTPHESTRWFVTGVNALRGTEDPKITARLLTLFAYAEWYAGVPIPRRLANVERAVAAAKESGDIDLVVSATTRLASTLSDAGRFDEAEARYREAGASASACSPKTRLALDRSWGINDLQRGDLASARRRFSSVAELEPPYSEGRAGALVNLGEVEFASGHLDAALDSGRQAKVIYDKLNAPWIGLVNCNLGAYALGAGRLDEATEALREGLALMQKSGVTWLTTVLEHHALLAALRKDEERAALLLGYTQAQYRIAGRGRQTTETLGYERLLKLLQERFTSEELEKLFASGAALEEGAAVSLALAVQQIS